MKTNILKSALLLVVTALLMTSCTKNDNDFIGPKTTNDAVITVPFFTIDENGQMPSADDQLIYEIRKQNPIITPAGKHLNWGEFSTVKGISDVQCEENGVRVKLDLTGLIPKGVYTVWNVVFDAPGMDPTQEMIGVDGLGAAGIGDGSDNVFTASSDGKASIEILSPGGTLSMLSNTDLGTCPLTDNFEWHVVGAYHLDGQTHGPSLGPDGTAIEQFGFIFKNEVK